MPYKMDFDGYWDKSLELQEMSLRKESLQRRKPNSRKSRKRLSNSRNYTAAPSFVLPILCPLQVSQKDFSLFSLEPIPILCPLQASQKDFSLFFLEPMESGQCTSPPKKGLRSKSGPYVQQQGSKEGNCMERLSREAGVSYMDFSGPRN